MSLSGSGGSIDFAVLASGSGTNLQALLDTPHLRRSIRLVVSDNPEAMALRRAETAGVQSTVVRWEDHADRDSFSSELVRVVRESGSDAMILAGFMRVISPDAVDAFRGRIINVHPSLLPSFPGLDAVGQALERGVRVSGVTIHIVDEQVDHGPILAQVAVPVYPEDDRKSLHARIQVEEHKLLPEVVTAFASGGVAVTGARVVWR